MEENLIYLKLGKQIKFLRENAHLTQEKLAEKCGISLDYLGKIEVNINKPGFKTIIKIANALNVSLKELFNF
ncbi:MAG: helix-turn-helix transcriptional regulator [Candidatus Gastranaerophilales bacterium]